MKKNNLKNQDRRSWMVALSGLGVALAIVVLGISSHAQPFSSGSDGSDGPLNVPANSGTFSFDPFDSSRWGRVLDPDGDGVYNFTTITIGANSRLNLRADKVGKPVYWLASGSIVIGEGAVIDLSGAAGTGTSDVNLRRVASVPGSGGYAGGAGGAGGFPRNPGEGPGGGSGGTGGCGISITPTCGNPGAFSGNRYLVPLVGGSGGEGAISNNGVSYGGGSGGGAILLASSVSITFGSNSASGIVSFGGSGAAGVGSGSGGAIRLVAPTIAGSGTLRVGGGGGPRPGGAGWIRLEGFSISNSLAFLESSAAVTRGSPVDPSTLRPSSGIRVTAVDGLPVSATPAGSLLLPDVSINKLGPVNVDMEAHGIPPGTVVTLQVFSQTPTDLNTVNVTTTAILAGTLQLSTATAQFTFPYGFSRGFVRATWTP